MLDVFACNYYHCPFIGLEEEFHFNPSYRRGKARTRVLAECPCCGQLGCHPYGSIYESDFKKEGLRVMRWQYRYFFFRDGDKCGITNKRLIR